MSDEIIDLNEFMERVQDDKDLLLELLDIFLMDFKEKRKSLQVAIADNNCDQIHSIAHSLKGATGNISAKPLRALFFKLEDMGKTNKPTGAKDVLKNIDLEFARFEIRVEEIKNELSG